MDYEYNNFDLEIENIELSNENFRLERELAREKRERINRKQASKKQHIRLATFYTIVGLAVGSAFTASAINIMHTNSGKREIASRVIEECLSDIGCVNYTSGYHFNIGNKNVDYDEAISEIKSRAKRAGFTDVELYIALSAKYNASLASSILPDVEKSEANELGYDNYLKISEEREVGYGRN